MNLIDVILPLPLDARFTYAVSESDFRQINIGSRVAVPFGKTKVYTGIVAEIHDRFPEKYELKEIEQIIDEHPLITPNQFQLIKWISDYYLCSEGEVLKAVLPNAFLLESETIVERNQDFTLSENELTDEEYLVFEALQNQSVIKIKEIGKLLEKKNVLQLLKKMVDKNAVLLHQEIYKKYQPKLVKYLKLGEDVGQNLQLIIEDLNNAPKQKEALLKFYSLKAKSPKPISKKKFKKEEEVSDAVLRALIDKQIFKEYHLQADRTKTDTESYKSEISYSEEQIQVLNEIKNAFSKGEVGLLHGVTSSGKTEIYIELIKQQLAKGKQVLYMLPEIALTTQLVSRMQAYFGNEVLVYHSKYTSNERVEVYKHVLNNTGGKIVIGVRSSVFLPFQNLGLVIVDESHENTYKQYQPSPRYHARDVAIVLAKIAKANILLGTATPSIESYYNALHAKFTLVELKNRFKNILPPEIQLVDLKEAHKKKKMKGHFSETLFLAIEATLEKGKQVILFQNRRGFSPILECNTCGHSVQCPNCDVSLTYHQQNNTLRCHYCGYQMAMQSHCLVCKSPELSTKGLGTEQVETELKVLFPKHQIGRMDLDTTRGKYGYEKIINRFQQQEIDILVGTQIVTKGLDFRNVDLVGVMNADNLLNFPDFRSHERCFQLLVQVAGRAGRTQERGKVLIQTYNPNHQILQQVTTNDYATMYKEQIDDRYNFKYPPVYRMVKIIFKGRDYNRLNEAADWFAKGLMMQFKENVLGPEFPAIARINNDFIKNIILKIPPKQSLDKTKQYLLKIKKSYEAVAAFRGIRLIFDVDPY
ncbi:primosomal protein N' [Mesonia sp. K7]|uniref:replication restart helicase PriA n=1 Tax=Mesonia sp. K7 TaxID=2218606 RepID=UPI000DA8CCC3|nr:primosomal protein N' [Mesonia sp. K7]PZD78234.1 primosomal protein N' [Mesonia sp. K7]